MLDPGIRAVSIGSCEWHLWRNPHKLWLLLLAISCQLLDENASPTQVDCDTKTENARPTTHRRAYVNHMKSLIVLMEHASLNGSDFMHPMHLSMAVTSCIPCRSSWKPVALYVVTEEACLTMITNKDVDYL